MISMIMGNIVPLHDLTKAEIRWLLLITAEETCRVNIEYVKVRKVTASMKLSYKLSLVTYEYRSFTGPCYFLQQIS